MLIDPGEQPGAEDALAEWYAQQEKAWGYLPNYASLFASRPDVGEAWSRLNLTVRGGMDRRRFELATIAASRARSSTYCLAAHSKFLRDACGDEAAMQALADDPTGSWIRPSSRSRPGWHPTRHPWTPVTWACYASTASPMPRSPT
jgi:AhpD family alkylhydroperoxidase